MHVLTFIAIMFAEIYVAAVTIWVCRLINKLLARPTDPFAMLQHMSALVPQQLRERIGAYMQQMLQHINTSHVNTTNDTNIHPTARPRHVLRADMRSLHN